MVKWQVLHASVVLRLSLVYTCVMTLRVEEAVAVGEVELIGISYPRQSSESFIIKGIIKVLLFRSKFI